MLLVGRAVILVVSVLLYWVDSKLVNCTSVAVGVGRVIPTEGNGGDFTAHWVGSAY